MDSIMAAGEYLFALVMLAISVVMLTIGLLCGVTEVFRYLHIKSL